VRNVLIAAGNSRDLGLVRPVTALLDDDNPVVRGAAIWALSQLDHPQFLAEKSARFKFESDQEVAAEWG
jgi:epoxyqueuosine reductase